MNTTSKSIQELVENIKTWNEAYRKGAPIVSDAFYDQEVEKLRNLELSKLMVSALRACFC